MSTMFKNMHDHQGYSHSHGQERLYDHGVDHTDLFPEKPDPRETPLWPLLGMEPKN